MTAQTNGPLFLRVGPGHEGDGTLALRINPEHADEVIGELRAAGFELSKGQEFSQGPALVLLFVAFTQAGGIQQLAQVFSTILKKHENNHFAVRDPGGIDIEADGYSEAQVGKLLEKVVEIVQKREGQWQRMSDEGERNSNHQPSSTADQDTAAEPKDEPEELGHTPT